MDERHKRIKSDDFSKDKHNPHEDEAVATPARLLWPGSSLLVIDPKGKNMAVKLRRRPQIPIFDPLREETSC